MITNKIIYSWLLLAMLGLACSPATNNSQQKKQKNEPDTIANPYELVWADEFDGDSLNSNYWSYETGAHGWGNNELQNYTNQGNLALKDGKLIITVKKEDDKKQVGSYTSARIVTKGKKEFTYGKIEARAKMPSGLGIWPAIWMLGANIDSVPWPQCGEIDIVEYVGFAPDTVFSTVHNAAGWGNNSNGNTKELKTIEEEFHVYGIIWNPDEIRFYTDNPDNITHIYAPQQNEQSWPYDKPHYLILNVAFGGDFGGSHGLDHAIFPQAMEVDYLRVYQLKN